MDEGVVGGEGEEEAEACGETEAPELEEPGGCDFAVYDEADEPGQDQGAEFVKMPGGARHGFIGGSIEEAEDEDRVQDGAGQEAQKEIESGLVGELEGAGLIARGHGVGGFLQYSDCGSKGTTARR
jgi:hypothetical protein